MPNTYNHLSDLSPEEINLMHLIRSGKYQSILIKLMEGQPTAVELKRTHPTHRKIVDVLREAPFQTITIKTHRGRIAHLESICKQRLE